MTPPTNENEDIDAVLSMMIGLIFDVDTDEFTDGTKQRYDKAKASLERWKNQRVIEELERLMALHTRTYRQTVTDNTGAIYVDDSHAYISKYETQNRIAQLRQQEEKTKEQ